MTISKQWRQREYRKGLICFFESLSLYLRAGFALPYSWPAALTALKGVIPEELERDLRGQKEGIQLGESLGEVLQTLKLDCRNASCRLWFGILLDLYTSGAGLTQSVEATAVALRREQEADLEAHCRSLPLKVNLVLIFFFLPPTFLWLFGPLVLEILSQIH